MKHTAMIHTDKPTSALTACRHSERVLRVLRGIAIGWLIAIAAKILTGCVTVNHTLEDGTRIYATPAGVGAATADGKSGIDLRLPVK